MREVPAPPEAAGVGLLVLMNGLVVGALVKVE